MISVRAFARICGFGAFLSVSAFAQVPPTPVSISVDAKQILDAAGPIQRQSLRAIYLIICPNAAPDSGFSAGSGFLLNSGVIVTNAHVVGTCTEQSLIGIGVTNNRVKFSRVIKDVDRDLALLVPDKKLANGLKLAKSDTPPPGTVVTTWGYPFLYDGASPLLSVGYVAGFRNVGSGKTPGKKVKHIVVNGAFNHGNSGGPLLIAHDNEVIGIVVLTYNFYPAGVRQIIDGLSKEKSGFQWTYARPDGSTQKFSEAELTSAVLDEFYQKTQVMIGEAIGASELANMIREHSSELSSLGIKGGS